MRKTHGSSWESVLTNLSLIVIQLHNVSFFLPIILITITILSSRIFKSCCNRQKPIVVLLLYTWPRWSLCFDLSVRHFVFVPVCLSDDFRIISISISHHSHLAVVADAGNSHISARVAMLSNSSLCKIMDVLYYYFKVRPIF